MSKLKYVFAWKVGEQWNCMTADDGAWYADGDLIELKIGEATKWFRLYERLRIGNTVTLKLIVMDFQWANECVLATSATAKFLLHLEGVKNDE